MAARVVREATLAASDVGVVVRLRVVASGHLGDAALSAGEVVVVKRARAEAEGAEQFLRREAQWLLAVGPPTVPSLRGTGRDGDGSSFLVVDLVGGARLDTLVPWGTGAPQASLAPQAAVALCVALLRALGRVHAAKTRAGEPLAHGDLVPANVIVSPSGAVTLLDLAQAGSAGDLPPPRARPAARYAAPEVLAGAPPSVAADLWSWAAVCQEVLGGGPVAGDGSALSALAWAAGGGPPRVANLDAPPSLGVALRQCLSRDAAGRPPSVAALLAALAAAG